MLINKDASMIYSTLFSASVCMHVFVCNYQLLYTPHVTILGKYRVVFLGGGSRKNKIEVRAVRFSLKFESDFTLTFLIDAEVPELKLADIYSQLYDKDRTIAKTSRGVKTHSMNQGRSQSGSCTHAKSVVET